MKGFPAICTLVLLAGCSSVAVPLPVSDTPTHPNSINGQLSRPWHHVGSPVTAQRQAEDEAKCKVIASVAAPSSDEIKYLVTYINCLKAAGYQPDPPNNGLRTNSP